MHESPTRQQANGAFEKKAGDVVLSHTVSCAVPSAQRGLTTVFGMGTGVTLAAKPPTNSGVWEFGSPGIWEFGSDPKLSNLKLASSQAHIEVGLERSCYESCGSVERLVCEVLVLLRMRTDTILLGLAKPLGRLVLLG